MTYRELIDALNYYLREAPERSYDPVIVEVDDYEFLKINSISEITNHHVKNLDEFSTRVRRGQF